MLIYLEKFKDFICSCLPFKTVGAKAPVIKGESVLLIKRPGERKFYKLNFIFLCLIFFLSPCTCASESEELSFPPQKTTRRRILSSDSVFPEVQSPQSVEDDSAPLPSSSKKMRRRIESEPLSVPSVLPSSLPLPKPPLEEFQKAIEIGLRTKLLANVYLGDNDNAANIFVPLLTLYFQSSNGNLCEETHFIRSDKGKICLFASGGRSEHVWEKGIHKIYPLLFKGDRIKIIRANWMTKHLHKDFGLLNVLGDSPEELHSEIFWKFYVTHFLDTQLSLLTKDRSLNHVEVRAFSWWDVCDGCYDQLPRLRNGISLTYNVVSARPYKKGYQQTPEFRFSFLQELSIKREEILKDIFERIIAFAEAYEDESKEAKRTFWTTHPGVDAAKWLGYVLNEENPLLQIYLRDASATSQAILDNLSRYLAKENWDLSCYYPPFTYPIQHAWKKYWGQKVIPHFGWHFVGEALATAENIICEMCGKKGIKDLSFLSHPKYRDISPIVKEEEPEEDYEPGKHVLGALSKRGKELRKKSLTVGSECVRHMILSRKDIKEKQKKLKKNRATMEPLKAQLARGFVED